MRLTEKYCFVSVTWFYFVIFNLLKFLTWKVNPTPLRRVLLFSATCKLHIAMVGIQHWGLLLGQLPTDAPHCVPQTLTHSKVPLKMAGHLPAWTTHDGHRFAEHKFQFARTSVQHWGKTSVITSACFFCRVILDFNIYWCENLIEWMDNKIKRYVNLSNIIQKNFWEARCSYTKENQNTIDRKFECTLLKLNDKKKLAKI